MFAQRPVWSDPFSSPFEPEATPPVLSVSHDEPVVSAPPPLVAGAGGQPAQAALFSHYAEDDLAKMLARVEATHDPKEKLLLWQKYEAKKGESDLERHGANKGAWFPDDDDRKQQARNRRRISAVKGESAEIERDVKRLLKKKKLRERDVDDLIERKTLEHDLEMKYALEMTSAKQRGNGSSIEWDQEELIAARDALAKLPAEHLDALWEMRREEDDGSAYGFAASQDGHKVNVYDAGRDDAHAMVHEIGHVVAEKQNPDAYAKYQEAAGWKELRYQDLRKLGITGDQIQGLKDTRFESSEKRHTIHKNGKVYMIDPYTDGGYLVVDETAVPKKDEATKQPDGDDAWEYARSSQREHFAEHYARAVDDHETVYADLVGLPAQREQAAQKAYADAQARGSKPEIAEAAKQLALAQKAQKQRKAQFDIMRDDVFDTDKSTRDAAARLGKQGLAPGLMRDFEAEAAKLSTPEQVRALEQRTAAGIPKP